MKNLKHLTPFKYFALTNFPYIEADFDALTTYELYSKICEYINEVAKNNNDQIDNFNELYATWLETKEYIDDYFENLDVQEEIDNKLDELIETGEFQRIVEPFFTESIASIPSVVTNWLGENITQETGYVIDKTLTVSDCAPDSKITGDKIKFTYDSLRTIADITTEDILDGVTFTDGNYIRSDNGNIGYSNDYCACLDYLPVEANTEYTFTRNGAVIYACYNSAKTYISGGASASEVTTPLTITTPANTSYIRVSCKIAGVESFGLYKELYTIPILKNTVYYQPIWERMRVIETGVTTSNYSELLPDVDNIKSDSIYKMYFSLRSTDIPAHLPFTRWITDASASLVTFGVNVGSNAGIMQLLISKNFVFIRHYSASWGNWEALKLEVNVGSGYGVVQHFTSLTEAVAFCTQYKKAKLNVYNGVFNLYDEFLAYYGNDFFTNFTANTTPKGLLLTNNIYIKCSSNSKIVFNYTGDNEYVMQEFSPICFLSASLDGFTLENATIEASNCRYCVHDDPSDTSRAYHNRYINCHMYIDNSQNDAWNNRRVIGGGLGRAGHIQIESCILNSEPYELEQNGIVSYHNDISTDQAKSRIEITNNYFINGSITIFYGGTSTTMTDVIITGNSYTSDVEKLPTREGTDVIDNMAIYKWNNEIRSE